MKGADKVICQAAAVLLLFAVTSAPASAQMGFGGAGGGEDMMPQMTPMLEMMKARMGKRRFAMLMQTMGPMMGQMMEGGSGGGFGGMIPGGMGGGDMSGMMGMLGGGGGDIMSMIGPMMRMANFGGGFGGGHRRHRRHYLPIRTQRDYPIDQTKGGLPPLAARIRTLMCRPQPAARPSNRPSSTFAQAGCASPTSAISFQPNCLISNAPSDTAISAASSCALNSATRKLANSFAPPLFSPSACATSSKYCMPISLPVRCRR